MTHSSNSNDIINEAKKTDQPTYTIRQISNLYKLPASTLRYYEDLGLLTDVYKRQLCVMYSIPEIRIFCNQKQ